MSTAKEQTNQMKESAKMEFIDTQNIVTPSFNGQVCDWPQNVDCSSRPEDNEVEKEPELEQIKCEEGIYRDPESCDSFYMCANGIKYPSQKCPDNLLFNGEVCDWPENVDCE